MATYTAKASGAELTIASSFPGEILPLSSTATSSGLPKNQPFFVLRRE
jgi:hypothetical protein